MIKKLKFIHLKLASIYVYFKYYYNPSWLKILKKVSNKIKSSNPYRQKGLKVLFGPSFSIYQPSIALDKIISTKLEYLGCDVVQMYCDAIQDDECNVWGGDWKGNLNFKSACKICKRESEKMWDSNTKNLIKLSDFINLNKRKNEIEKNLHLLDLEHLLKFKDDGINYGQLARDIIVNNRLVSSLNLIPNRSSLMKIQIKNLIILKECYEHVIKKIKPDRVISNDSFYGMWKVLEIICKKSLIPFYSQYPITQDRVVIKQGGSAVDFNFKESWEEFKKKPISKFEEKKLNDWLKGARGLYIDTTKPLESLRVDPVLNNINKSKPTILIAANLIWDLSALNKEIIFNDMLEWINETIEWFRYKSEFQLIIKPHPLELSNRIPNTNETVESGVYNRFKKIPSNVHLLKPNTKITTNEILELYDIRAVAVHTTTVGFEFPIYGTPCITTAKATYRGYGFTIDPKNKKEYFTNLSLLLSDAKKKLRKSDILLAKKYLKFYKFHYFLKLNIFEGNPVSFNSEFEKKILSEHEPLNTICKKIIEGNPINDKHTWPEFSS